jgi:hypothetical protein
MRGGTKKVRQVRHFLVDHHPVGVALANLGLAKDGLSPVRKGETVANEAPASVPIFVAKERAEPSHRSTSELVLAFQDGGYEQGPRVGVAVPEPASFLMLTAGLIGIATCGRHVGP